MTKFASFLTQGFSLKALFNFCHCTKTSVFAPSCTAWTGTALWSEGSSSTTTTTAAQGTSAGWSSWTVSVMCRVSGSGTRLSRSSNTRQETSMRTGTRGTSEMLMPLWCSSSTRVAQPSWANHLFKNNLFLTFQGNSDDFDC